MENESEPEVSKPAVKFTCSFFPDGGLEMFYFLPERTMYDDLLVVQFVLVSSVCVYYLMLLLNQNHSKIK